MVPGKKPIHGEFIRDTYAKKKRLDVLDVDEKSEVPFKPIETAKPSFTKGEGLKAVTERFKENEKESEAPLGVVGLRPSFSNPVIEKMEKALRRRPPRRF